MTQKERALLEQGYILSYFYELWERGELLLKGRIDEIDACMSESRKLWHAVLRDLGWSEERFTKLDEQVQQEYRQRLHNEQKAVKQ